MPGSTTTLTPYNPLPQSTHILSDDMPTDWKDLLSASFGVDPSAETPEPEPAEVPPATAVEQQGAQPVTIMLSKKGRSGKVATLVVDLRCHDNELQALASTLRHALSVGGSARGGEILLQGDVRQRAAEILRQQGFKVRIN